MTLFLSRLTLSNAPAAAALKPLLDPQDQGMALDAHHRLIWSLFADHPDRRRDFLWRADENRHFFTLSARPPEPNGLFFSVDTKPFEPNLRAGDRLTFTLRVNATVGKSKPDSQGRVRRVHDDIVMNALRALPSGRESSARADARMQIALDSGTEWFVRQGKKSGFHPVDMRVDGYSVKCLPRYQGARKGQPQFGILDLEGTLEVRDDALFVARLAEGFGRAKAFGCGLMLIRRAA